jgi:hypothetical protein
MLGYGGIAAIYEDIYIRLCIDWSQSERRSDVECAAVRTLSYGTRLVLFTAWQQTVGYQAQTLMSLR